jgi:plasmid stability protein
MEELMATLTLKNIPDDLHARLKESAEKNRRSLNSEILIRLESGFSAPLVDPRDHARELKAFTDGQKRVDHSLFDQFKRRGRM